ncbi:MAG TPA: FAD-binding oxidoreductase [Flexilinea sp.]|nr:FAD-binding oxidoreductase [Flexilinea sp.]
MNYKKLDEKDIAFLRDVCGEDRVILGKDIPEDFCHDEMEGQSAVPEVMVFVLNATEVSLILYYANQKQIPVTPRGQGTGLVGGAVPIYGGILMNLSKMNRILELDEENFTLTVEPGVLIMDIYDFVEAHDLYYPPNPGEKSASIGGNVATNAGGMSAVKYGVTRDYVRGLEIVTPEGDILEIGGKIAKNSSGYSLVQLVTGSEGTLAVITKIILRLLPKPKVQQSLLVPFQSLSEAIQTVPKIIKTKVIPRSIEFMTQDMLQSSEQYLGRRFPDHTGNAYLLLAFDGNSREEVEKDSDQLAELCLREGAIDAFIIDTDERNEAVWKPRSSYLEIIKASTTDMDECDVVVPISRIADYLEFSRKVEEEAGFRVRSMGHAGDGNLHIYACRDHMDETVWKEKSLANMVSALPNVAISKSWKVRISCV